MKKLSNKDIVNHPSARKGPKGIIFFCFIKEKIIPKKQAMDKILNV